MTGVPNSNDPEPIIPEPVIPEPDPFIWSAPRRPTMLECFICSDEHDISDFREFPCKC